MSKLCDWCQSFRRVQARQNSRGRSIARVSEPPTLRICSLENRLSASFTTQRASEQQGFADPATKHPKARYHFAKGSFRGSRRRHDRHLLVVEFSISHLHLWLDQWMDYEKLATIKQRPHYTRVFICHGNLSHIRSSLRFDSRSPTTVRVCL